MPGWTELDGRGGMPSTAPPPDEQTLIFPLRDQSFDGAVSQPALFQVLLVIFLCAPEI